MERRRVETRARGIEGSIRLVEWLSARFSYLDSAAWDACIAEGRLSVDGRRALAGESVRDGCLVAFDPGDMPEPDVDTRWRLIHEEGDFLVVAKPPQLPCHPGGRFWRNSLWYLLRERFGPLHIATRLDRETSGLVLACRSPEAAAHAQALQARGALRKDYLVMVHGFFPEFLDAEGFLLPDRGSSVRKKRRFTAASGPGEAAVACRTAFRILGRAALPGGADLSLLRAEPSTGRTHQIRASLLSCGFPVVGDKLYGLDEGIFLRFAEGRPDPGDAATALMPFQALHCGALGFEWPPGKHQAFSLEPDWPFPYPLFGPRPLFPGSPL